MVAQQNFQPQVGDTTAGPHQHTYISRSDGSILLNGTAYVPQAGTAAAAVTVPVPVQAATTVIQPTAIPIVTPPGGPPTVSAPVPLVYQPPPQQYVPYAQPGYPYQPQPPYIIQPQPSTTGLPTFHIQQPAFGTFGLTGQEVMMQQLATAQGLEMNKKQEMKPADDDQFRMYWCRELDGTWTQRNRLTIDSGDIGDCRWYAVDGNFYAVRLPMS